MPAPPPFLQQRLEFPFPALEPEGGIPLVNGAFGALLWGDRSTARLTLNHSDYPVDEGAGPVPAVSPGWTGEHPPMGRVDLLLPEDWTIASGGLHLLTGEAELELENRSQQAKLRAVVLEDAPVLCIRVTGADCSAARAIARPPDAPELVERLRQSGFPRPHTFDLTEFAGWVQELPWGGAVCVGWLTHLTASGLLLYVTAVNGVNAVDARRNALLTLEGARGQGYTPVTLRTFSVRRRDWLQPEPEAPSMLERLFSTGAFQAVNAATLGRLMDGSVDPASVGLRAHRSGEVAVYEGGNLLARGTLRPAWMSGDRIRGHRPELRRPGFVLPQPA